MYLTMGAQCDRCESSAWLSRDDISSDMARPNPTPPEASGAVRPIFEYVKEPNLIVTQVPGAGNDARSSSSSLRRILPQILYRLTIPIRMIPYFRNQILNRYCRSNPFPSLYSSPDEASS